ncbi:efflux RND transporter permease subunit [Thalassotalea marina]|uniref:Acriflavin resistance protein n=1 Tax=Thalassotalea marina TaxID=1673741 RepID=A0A919BKH1_9GAMM|nr:efflux RND transporter permease subunit [Thalassotalea marina]GHF97344.1 acriflavin resistance protein [Thalassotalea marina]
MKLVDQTKNITALALKRPVTCFMLMLSMFAAGLISSKLIPLDSWPAVNAPQVNIRASYPGSTPEEIERLITKPLEEALSTMSGINVIRSQTSSGWAMLTLQMKFTADLNSAILEAREKVDMVRHLLPEDLERVDVMKFSTQDIPVVELTLLSDKSLSRDYEFLEKHLKMPLERISGVGRVELYLQQPRVWIQLDPDKIAMNRIDIQTVTQALRQANFLKSVGEVQTNDYRYTVTPQGQYRNIEDIRAQRINERIRLSDIASVEYALTERQFQRRINGQPAVGLDIFRESDANVVDVSTAIKAVIEEAKNKPQLQHINIDYDRDDGHSVEVSIASLLKAGAIGAVLSFFVLWFFLRNLKLTSVVVLAVPVSLSISLAIIYFMGFSLNMLTLLGLIIAIGLLIDNSVVVCESILQQRAKGHTGKLAVVEGVDNVSVAILSATLTTVVIFLPLQMGEGNFFTVMLQQVAVSICVPLLVSLLVAKTLIPLCMYRVLPESATDNEAGSDRAQQKYRNVLNWGLSNPKRVGAFFLIMFVSVMMAKSMVDKSSSDAQSQKRLRIFYEFNGEPELEKKLDFLKQVESYLLTNKSSLGIKKLYSGVFSRGAWSNIEFVEDLPRPIEDIKKDIKENFPISAYAKASLRREEGSRTSVSVFLFGRSTSKLNDLAEQLIPVLEAHPHFSEVRNGSEGDMYEMQLIVDRQRAMQLGVSTQEIAGKIGNAVRGINLKTMRTIDKGEVQIVAGYFEKDAIPMNEFKRLPVMESNGAVLTLQQLVTIETRPAPSRISRMDRQTQLALEMNLVDVSHKEAAKSIEELMSAITLPKGYSWGLGPKFAEQDESMKQMGFNMLIALCLIFMIMAALFESLLLPIAILSSIGLGFVGVYWTFAALGMGLGETGMIGMLVLMGIVVNNGIVLIDQINRFKGSAEHLKQAIIEACSTRLRPILMTVATTVIGMMPVLFDSSSADSGVLDYKPMAIAIIGGLIFSTITSLAFVPYCYYILYKLGHGTSGKIAKARAYANQKLARLG